MQRIYIAWLTKLSCYIDYLSHRLFTNCSIGECSEDVQKSGSIVSKYAYAIGNERKKIAVGKFLSILIVNIVTRRIDSFFFSFKLKRHDAIKLKAKKKLV